MLRMREHRLPSRRVWLLVIIAVVLIAGHGFLLYYFRAHLVLSAAVLWGLIAVVVINHLGLLGSLFSVVGCRFLRFDVAWSCHLASTLRSVSLYPFVRRVNPYYSLRLLSCS